MHALLSPPVAMPQSFVPRVPPHDRGTADRLARRTPALPSPPTGITAAIAAAAHDETLLSRRAARTASTRCSTSGSCALADHLRRNNVGNHFIEKPLVHAMDTVEDAAVDAVKAGERRRLGFFKFEVNAREP